MRSRSKVPGTPSLGDGRKPSCRQCLDEGRDAKADVIRLQGDWRCRRHLKVKNMKYTGPSLIVMPTGVRDPREQVREFIPLTEIFPNRRARRLAKAT